MFDGKTVWFIVRGVAGVPGDMLEWEMKVRDQIIQSTERPAVAISYGTTPLTVWMRRKWRALRLAHVLRGYTARDWRIHVIAHSEGTVAILDALRLLGWPRVEALHLVCGACDSDFNRNGLNWALRTGGVGHVQVYIAGEDHAMKWEDLVLGKLLFGIPERSRPLGLNGPRNVDGEYSTKVKIHRESPWDNWGHSTCWEGRNLDKTVDGILAENQVHP